MTTDEILTLADKLLTLDRYEVAQELILLHYTAHKDGMDAYDKIYKNIYAGAAK